MNTEKKAFDCCPPFDPAPWDGKRFEWSGKKLIKGKVCTFFYMPINFGSVIAKLNKKMEAVGAECPDWMALSDHTSKWNMDLYVAVDREIPDAENVTLSGTFISKVYEGEYKHMKEWHDDFDAYAQSQGVDIEKRYAWYTTCPKCSKKYGKNYVVMIGKIQ